MKERKIVVNDLMQSNYVYFCTEPMGQNFHDDFRPELSPKLALELGIFGGKYMTDCEKEFPSDWFSNARLCSGRRDPDLNFFGVNASQPLSVWKEKGWINPNDPRGWFQWYCRYFLGRRDPQVDARQIKRWRAFARHAGAGAGLGHRRFGDRQLSRGRTGCFGDSTVHVGRGHRLSHDQ